MSFPLNKTWKMNPVSACLREGVKEPKKSTEILSFTNAAVQALSTANSNGNPEKTSLSSEELKVNSASSTGSDSSLVKDQLDVVTLAANTSSSPSNDDSKMDMSLDSSFDRRTAHRVRISSRLLREIKSPQDRTAVSPGNVQRDIQQPETLVVRHVDEPSAWVSVATSISLPDNVIMTHPGPATSAKTTFTHEVTRAKDLNNDHKNPTQSGTFHEATSEDRHGNKDVKHTDDERVINTSTTFFKKMPFGLCQGDPITGGVMTYTKNSDSTKAKCFSLSERERALKEEFMKRKDGKSAPVKRVVQPTVVAMKERSVHHSNPDIAGQDNPVVSAAAIAAAAVSAATAPFLQMQHGLESQISALVSSLNLLHEQQSKLEHQKFADQELRLQEQINARLKKLEEVQKQILGLQNSQRCPPNFHKSEAQDSQRLASETASPEVFVTSTAASVPYRCPETIHQAHSRQPITKTVDFQIPPVSYVPAAQNFNQKAAQTQTCSSTKDPSPKFKLVKNTKTQTSPQDSSVLFGDSPLQTPLPRKRPPLPMTRDTLSHTKELHYSDLPRGKRVYFNDQYYPGTRISQPSKSVSEIQSGHNPHVMNGPNARFQMPHPQRMNIQEKEKCPTDLAASKEVIDDLSRIKKDLKSVMAETEKIKDNLSFQKIKGEIDQSFSQMNKGPSPLDAYLSLTEISRPAGRKMTDKLAVAPAVQHYADAEHILRNVQLKRNNLESNLNAIVRQSDEEHLYAAVDTMIQQSQGDETLRIRKDIDSIIKELNLAVKKEIEGECKSSNVQSDSTTAKKQENKKPKARYVPGTAMSKRQPRKALDKENVPDPKNNAKKPKTIKPSSNRVRAVPKSESKPVSKPAKKPETYLTSVYGRQSYHPQRITSKAPYLHYQSPVNPRTAALTSAILGAGSRVTSKQIHQETEKPVHIRSEERIQGREMPRYYFHPDMDMSHVISSGEKGVTLDTPVEGHLVPMAIPLGKPKTDQSLRLPLTMVTTTVTDAESTVPQPSPVPHKKATPSKPNVAMITIRDKEIGDESTDYKRKRAKTHSKRPAELGVQILPQMDIDSFTESSDSVATPLPHVTDVPGISEPLKRPDNTDYEDFRNYITVRDTESGIEEKDDEDGDIPRIPTPENHLTIKGHTEKDHLYHGPPFPPQHPPLLSNAHPGVLDAEDRMNNALEDRAVEWVEQELLARIVSEMNGPLPDPTLVARSPTESSSDDSVTDDGDMLAATIGLGGIQLFVDAGIPVDRDFVAKLIRDVIAEQIVSTLGYPKPTAASRPPQEDVQDEAYSPEPAATPVSTPLPTPVYTPVESESSEPHSPPVATPDPSTAPSESSDTIESEREPTPVKEPSEAKEQTDSEVSEVRSPVPTPVATPTGSHTPTTSVTTPEPSTQEPQSEVGSPVTTPEATERTPSPLPEPSSISTPPVESSVTTSKPPSITSSPPSMTTTSTLSTPGTTSTMTTIDEELSEGQLLQPYVHMGQFSEGEYTAVFCPGVERKIPADEALDVLGKDEDSRNHLIRVALNGLLRRSLGSSSSTVSTASTLKDPDDIREDSLGDFARSEGEIIFPRDHIAASAYGLRTSGPDSTSSEGELVSTHRSHGASPGEFRSAVLGASISPHSPGEISGHLKPKRVQPTTTNIQVVKEPASPENTESRSLHTSDLHQKEGKGIRTQQLVANGVGTVTRYQENNESQYNDKGYVPSDGKEPVSRPPPVHVPIPPMDEERPDSEQEDTYGDVSSISGGDF